MIKQAIIPLAGLGTRLLPLTNVIPKELLPINGKPGLEYIIEECIDAGIKDIILIISKRKMMIKDYFQRDSIFKKLLKNKKDNRILKEYKKIKKFKKMIRFVYQNTPTGTGDAILKAKNLIKDNYFLILLPDDLIIKSNCSKSMISVHKKYNSSVMASINVGNNNVSRWGIYKIKKKLNKNNFLISGVVEKPSKNKAPSNKAVIGRYILSKKIFKKLKKQKKGKSGEIHITDAIQSLVLENNKFIGHNFAGKYLDCGTMNGYIKSSIKISKI